MATGRQALLPLNEDEDKPRAFRAHDEIVAKRSFVLWYTLTENHRDPHHETRTFLKNTEYNDACELEDDTVLPILRIFGIGRIQKDSFCRGVDSFGRRINGLESLIQVRAQRKRMWLTVSSNNLSLLRPLGADFNGELRLMDYREGHDLKNRGAVQPLKLTHVMAILFVCFAKR